MRLKLPYQSSPYLGTPRPQVSKSAPNQKAAGFALLSRPQLPVKPVDAPWGP